ncbi:GNAT family N-acetyltransferase [uncultured Methanofollis sp.]|uniref:GNAT family N-acetyltransferase n=1 Tax=uncultured Methanofollis sp. TaxID=262500 RepID=UPI0026295BC9|nr:GNAT family N-acetyltransferase [uncultured Methanofollis sp.]
MIGGPGISEISVRRLEPDELPVWDAVVSSAPEGSIFHSSPWLSVMSCGREIDYTVYGFFNGDDLIGGCPLFFYQIGGLISVGTSIPPMNPYGGIVLLPLEEGSARACEQRQQDVVRSLIQQMKVENYASIHIVHAPEWQDIRCFIWEGWETNVLYTYYLDPANFSMSRNARRNMKKGRENGIVIQKFEDIDMFYKLFEYTFQNRGMAPPLQKPLLRSIFKTFHERGNCELVTAHNRDGDVIGGDIYLTDNRRVYRWAAATTPEAKASGASFLLLYESLLDFGERGYRQINLMTANIPYLAEFTQNFSPHLVPYYGVKNRSVYLKVSSAFRGT